MGVQRICAEVISRSSTFVLKNVFRRPAANFPGKIALYADPHIIADLTYKLSKGSIVVVGTNGKTTITNMIADALEAQGKSVVCNRTGANLDSGIATSLLHTGKVEWGVFESDELWLAKSLPQLKANYVLLLNLFRDQLDRCGEIDTIQTSIVKALASSPETTLIFNADDPLCAAIAERASNPTIAFGIDQDLKLPQNTVTDAQMCQMCSGMFDYSYRQYGQLGDYRCPECGFARPAFDRWAKGVRLGTNDMEFDVYDASGEIAHIEAPYSGAYMVYNLLATFVACRELGAGPDAFNTMVRAFNPENGRLQSLRVQGRDVLLNLAKNPTGFNQNMKLITRAEGRKVAAFFINDREADGHDISWIWDIDFEELAGQEDIIVFAGGIRANDVQVRLRYAGIEAHIVEDVDDVLAAAATLDPDWNLYMIANYTALPAVREKLMARASESPAAPQARSGKTVALSSAGSTVRVEQSDAPADPLRIVHMYPDLLNLYGDGGNPKVLAMRCRWRGIPVQIDTVNYGDDVDLKQADIVFLGGGPDREQKLASEQLLSMKNELRDYVEDDGVLLGICGGYQIMGNRWLLGDDEVEGLGLVDIDTRRAGTDRLIENIVLRSEYASFPVVGYENHAGRTFLGDGLQPFGTVISTVGHGNNDTSHADGVIYRNVIGTYLHGPLLGKNPEIADRLLEKALSRKLGRAFELVALDDGVELAANTVMSHRLGVK